MAAAAFAALLLWCLLLEWGPVAARVSSLRTLRPGSCPLTYQRHTYEEVRNNGTLPYLFGGRQRPACTNCDRDHLWSNFCQFKSHGQLCNPKDSKWLMQQYVDREWRQLLTLTPCDLWPFLEGRTLWVMGDSQGLDLYKALKCFLFEFWNLDSEAPPVPAGRDPPLDEALSRFLDPACVTLPRRARVCYVRFDTGDYLVDTLLPAFPRYGSARDVLLVNFGLHHGEKPEYQGVLRRFSSYIRRHRRALPDVFWQMTTPQHFRAYQGEYPGGTAPFECVELNGVRLLPDGSLRVEGDENQELLRGGWRNIMAQETLSPAGVSLVPSYNETVPLYYYHRDNGKGYECSHFCFPSAQQTWVFAIYRAFSERYAGVRVIPTAPFDDRPGELLE